MAAMAYLASVPSMLLVSTKTLVPAGRPSDKREAASSSAVEIKSSSVAVLGGFDSTLLAQASSRAQQQRTATAPELERMCSGERVGVVVALCSADCRREPCR